MFKRISRSFVLRLTLIIFCCLLFSAAFTIFILLLMLRLGLVIPPARFSTFVFLSFCVSCVTGTVIGVFFARRFAGPYEKFKKSMKEVANGNFDISLTVGDDLLDPIIEDFNTMVEELKSVQILRNDFISNFSHELKTPITSINGFSELLLAEDCSEEEKREYARIIYEESSRLLSLAKNTLLLSKLEGQAVVSDKKVFALNELIDDCLILLAKQFEEKNITVTTDIEKIFYYWDPNLLNQVVLNLVSNAIKHGREGGNVFVSLKRVDGKSIALTVSDDGNGMDEQTKERIFEKYYQGDGSHKTEGNGLGLSIVQRIVVLCQGRIEVKSELEKGSSFTVILPQINVE